MGMLDFDLPEDPGELLEPASAEPQAPPPSNDQEDDH